MKKEQELKKIVINSIKNQRLSQEEKGFREFKSRIDIDLDEKILVLDKDLFKEMKSIYKKADGFNLLYQEGIWKKNNFSNPIMTYSDFKKSF